jgi:hypothetical protein
MIMEKAKECIDKLIGRTPSGEIYVMKSYDDSKVTIELLQYEAIFEPKVILHDGQISFAGTYTYGDKQYEIIIPGTNDTVKLYERAVG